MKMLNPINLLRLIICKIKLLAIAIVIISLWNNSIFNSPIIEIEKVEILNAEENVESSVTTNSHSFFKLDYFENVCIGSVDLFTYFSTNSHSFSIRSERSPPFYI